MKNDNLHSDQNVLHTESTTAEPTRISTCRQNSPSSQGQDRLEATYAASNEVKHASTNEHYYMASRSPGQDRLNAQVEHTSTNEHYYTADNNDISTPEVADVYSVSNAIHAENSAMYTASGENEEDGNTNGNSEEEQQNTENVMQADSAVTADGDMEPYAVTNIWDNETYLSATTNVYQQTSRNADSTVTDDGDMEPYAVTNMYENKNRISATTNVRRQAPANSRSDTTQHVNNLHNPPTKLVPNPMYVPNQQANKLCENRRRFLVASVVFLFLVGAITTGVSIGKQTPMQEVKNLSIGTTDGTTLPSLGTTNGTTPPSLGTTNGTTPPNLGTTDGTTPPSLGTTDGTTPPSLGTTDGTTLPNLGTTDGTTPPSLGTTDGTTLPNLGTTDGTTPPSLGTTDGTTPPSLGTTDGTTPPSLGTTDGTTLPNLGTNDGTTPPSLGTTDGTTPPNLGTTDGTTPPSLGTTDGTTPPNLGTTDGTTPPSLGTTDGTTPPNLGTTDGTTPPSLGTTDGTTPPSLGTTDGTTPPSLETTDGTTHPALGPLTAPPHPALGPLTVPPHPPTKETMRLSCAANEMIVIDEAFYGRRENGPRCGCTGKSCDTCQYSESSQESRIRGLCQALQQCNQRVHNGYSFYAKVHRLCWGRKMYLEVTYHCEEVKKNITFGGKGEGPGQFDRMSGLAVSSTNEIFVADVPDYTIQVFSMKGVFLRSFSTGNMKPRALCMGHKDTLWVVLCRGFINRPSTYENAIQQYSKEGHELAKFIYSETVTIYGIAWHKLSDRIILTTKGTRNFGKIVWFSPTYTPPIPEFIPAPKPSVTQLIPFVDTNGNIYIIDMLNSHILKYDKNGVYLSSFGNIKYPSGMCVDSLGRVIVVNTWNSQVEMFTAEGQHIRTVAYINKPKQVATVTAKTKEYFLATAQEKLGCSPVEGLVEKPVQSRRQKNLYILDRIFHQPMKRDEH
ncbi:hypothetical protein Bbelb_211510 [Branchiostoma belcheri]|nr:hypothetical protein Bbelb_211510 [Branchiostoma belcheri]